MKRRIQQHEKKKQLIGVVLLLLSAGLAVVVKAGPPPPPPRARSSSLQEAGDTIQKSALLPPPPPQKISTTTTIKAHTTTVSPTTKDASTQTSSSNNVDALMERFNRIVESKHDGGSKKDDDDDDDDSPVVAKKPFREAMDAQKQQQAAAMVTEEPFRKKQPEQKQSGSTKPPPPPPMKSKAAAVVVVEEDDDDDDELVLGDAAAAHAPPEATTLFHAPQAAMAQQRQQAPPPQRPPPPMRQQQAQGKRLIQQQQPPPRQQQHPPPRQQQQQPRQQESPTPRQQFQAPPGQTRPQQQYQQQPPRQYYQQQQQQRPPQQQQQQQRPPPQYRQGPPPHRRPPPQQQPQKSILKSLWGRVEKGLDSLANVEELVTDRASQLTSQVTQQAKELLHKPTSILTSSRTVDPPPQQQQQQPVPQGAFGAAKTVATPNVAATKQQPPPKQSSSLPNSLAALYAMPTTAEAEDSSDDEDDTMMNPSASGPWDKNVIIGTPKPIARAGASDDRTPGALYGRQSSPFTQLQRDSQQRMHQQQQQQRPQQQPTRPRAFVAARSDPVVQQEQARPQYDRSDSFDSINSEGTWKARLSGLVPSLPRMPSVLSKILGRGSGSFNAMNDATMDVWKEDERIVSKKRFGRRRKKESKNPKGRFDSATASSSSTPPLTDLLARCDDGKSTSLLSSSDLRQCRSIGRRKAVVDVVCLGLVVFGVHQLLSVSPNLSSQHTVDSVIAAVVSLFAEATQGWAFYAFLAAFFTSTTNLVLFDGQIRAMKHAVANTIEGASQYSQLYMRLVSGHTVDKHVPERLQQAARAQTAELIQTSRMHNFVLLVLATMILMTVSVVQRILFAILASLGHAVTLPELYSWPVPWKHVGTSLKEIVGSLGGTIQQQVSGEVSTFLEHPMAVGFQLSVVAVLVAVAFLPTLEHRRKVRRLEEDEEEDEDVTASAFGTVATLSNLGVSSASRLGLLSKSGAIEGTLERWRNTLPPRSTLGSVRRLNSLMRHVGYNTVATLLLLIPVLVHMKCGVGDASKASGTIRFDSIWDVSILLLFMFRLSWKTISKTIASSEFRPYVQSFVRGLGQVVQEVSGTQQGSLTTPLGSPISPTSGLSVRDVWAAHTSKRAWAVRGASLDCHNGEVVAVLGDDGAGKSRLLTAIAEAIVNPSKGSLTTTKVRGSVLMGGLDVSKWDKAQLMKRVGLLLNDVRTTADNAVFMSGFTLEEVLEPMDGLLTRGSSTPTASARAVSQAMQITGLSKSLLPRLPGKMSTAVTANENELTPSELRPRCHSLSPSEWSKVLLARVLAQTIFDNDNVSNAPLVGSLLLLDDLTMPLSEVEELRIVQELRKTGAATVFSSHKWASGRLADRVVVVKGGSIVESGTHNELLARGPQHSIYAAQWQAMSTG